MSDIKSMPAWKQQQSGRGRGSGGSHAQAGAPPPGMSMHPHKSLSPMGSSTTPFALSNVPRTQQSFQSQHQHEPRSPTSPSAPERTMLPPVSSLLTRTKSVEPFDEVHFQKTHPLLREWMLSYDNPKARTDKQEWGTAMKNLMLIRTVEEFWRAYNNLPQLSSFPFGYDLHMFVKDVTPAWEDVANADGGKWSFSVPRDSQTPIDEYWLVLLLSCIGEQLEEGDEICGAVVSVRKISKVALWTRHADKKDAVMRLGSKMKELLELPDGALTYTSHASAKVSSHGAEAMYRV